MRLSQLLALCLLAAFTSALHAPGPMATPSPRLERRLVARPLMHRAPLFITPGNDDGSDGVKGSNTNTNTNTDANPTRSSATTSSTSSSSSSSSSSSTRSSSSSTRTSATSTTTTTPSSSVGSTTNSAGSVIMVTSTVPGASSTSALPAETSAPAQKDEGSSHTGLIIGVSVVGGVALIGVLIFLYMKFGGRRFSEYQDDDADIKWPELKADENAAAMQPLPARRTGGAGFDMGDESDNGHEGGDAHSMTEYGAKAHDSMIGSSTALNAGMGSSAYGTNSYGHQAPTEEYEEASAYGAQPGVTGYYDPYGNYPAGQTGAQQGQQIFYPEQVSSGNEYGGYSGYGQGQPDAFNANTSPPSGPYRVGGRPGF